MRTKKDLAADQSLHRRCISPLLKGQELKGLARGEQKERRKGTRPDPSGKKMFIFKKVQDGYECLPINNVPNEAERRFHTIEKEGTVIYIMQCYWDKLKNKAYVDAVIDALRCKAG